MPSLKKIPDIEFRPPLDLTACVHKWEIAFTYTGCTKRLNNENFFEMPYSGRTAVGRWGKAY